MTPVDLTNTETSAGDNHGTPARSAPAIGAEYFPVRSNSVLSRAATAWRAFRLRAAQKLLQPRNRRIRVAETVSLGEKRFLAIVEVDGGAYLIGGGASTVALVTALRPSSGIKSFQQATEEALHRADVAQ